jgi:hypothetical protein
LNRQVRWFLCVVLLCAPPDQPARKRPFRLGDARLLMWEAIHFRNLPVLQSISPSVVVPQLFAEFVVTKLDGCSTFLVVYTDESLGLDESLEYLSVFEDDAQLFQPVLEDRSCQLSIPLSSRYPVRRCARVNLSCGRSRFPPRHGNPHT